MLKQTVCSREAPLLPAILRFSIPLMLTGILQLAYNTADSIIVGRYAGHASLAAVGSTTSIIFLIITLFNGVSIGANYMAARDFGAQDDNGLFRTVHCAAFLSVILGLLACVCGLLLSTPLLRWADAPEDVLPLSVLYLRIYFLGVPALVVYNFGSALLRAVGDTFYPLLFMIVSGALNVALNLLLVVVIPLDVAGVAIATSVSQLLSAVLVTVRLCTFRGPCRLDLRKIRLYPDRTGQMLRLGFSAGLQGVIFSAANVMIQSAINSFGSVVMAGSSAASGIENFVHTALNTFYQSAITFTGQSMGASDPRRAVRVFQINLALTTGLGIVLCALAQIFQVPLLGLYVQSSDPAYDAVIAAGVVRVLALSRFQWVGGLMEGANPLLSALLVDGVIGGVIAVFALCIRKELLLPLLCGVFLVESFSVMMQVGYFKYTKRKYGEGHRLLLMAPVHHHFQKKGQFETKIVLRFWIISLLLAAITLVTLKIR